MAVQYITVGPGVLRIGDDAAASDFSSQITAATIKPKVDQSDSIPVLSGEEIAGDRSESFTLEGSLLQDLGATDSRVEWLWEHRGEKHPFSYIPANSAGRQITGELIVEAVELGGEVKKKPQSDFEFQLVGAPQIGTAPSGTP